MDAGALIETVGNAQMKNESCFPSLTIRQRFTGWAVCTVIGIVLSIFSMFALFQIATGRAEKFAIAFTLGHICSLAGTTFLMGPVRQFKSMFAKVRIIATLLYISLMVLTLVFALVLDKKALALVCAIGQWCAYIWYCMSYVPYSRQLARYICNKGFSE